MCNCDSVKRFLLFNQLPLFMHVETLEKAIIKSWDRETCYPGCVDEWNPENPAWGQCAVTALVVQDYLGGELLYCQHNHHYWNRLPNQEEVDFTRIQFPAGTVVCLDDIKSRDYVLNSESAIKAITPQRHELLKSRVEQNSIENNGPDRT